VSHDLPPAKALDFRAWIHALGPGAIVASLTIGTGELVFSTRAGALFGYQALGIFTLVLLLKWALVFASARYWVFTGVHPVRRWAELPGPRGALPMILLLLAAPAFPVWVSFHSATIGSLVSALTGTREGLGGNASLAWGIVVLIGVQVLSATGGYARQEKFQTLVVAAMLGSVVVALLFLGPDWGAMISGFFHFGPLHYPDWATGLPGLKDRPVWVEAATYAGVLGGSGYDYLAYVGWLRDKHGNPGEGGVSRPDLMKLVLADGVVSFLAVLIFSAVFVACGAIILGPRHEIPSGGDLLTLQAQFVAVVGPWLKPLYFVGAFLALGGTLYGTIEVAPTVARELVAAVMPVGRKPPEDAVLRRVCVRWCGFGALLILGVTLAWRLAVGSKEALDLVKWITPANLLTGVLACGWISWLNLWTYARAARSEIAPCPQRTDAPVWGGVPRLGWFLTILNAVGGAFFVGVGLKAGWDQLGLGAVAILGGSVVIGGIAAAWWGKLRE
jgi:hypothetical protein